MRTTVRLDEKLLERARKEAARRGATLAAPIEKLCGRPGATGNLVRDAWFAAVAIDSGCEWFTTDRDYARFSGLTWRPPF